MFGGNIMELTNCIRQLRFEQHEMTQQELADLVGVSRMTIYSIEKGKYIPSALLALKIAKVFHKQFEEVFFISEGESLK
jgi:putative transcriptional regulator